MVLLSFGIFFLLLFVVVQLVAQETGPGSSLMGTGWSIYQC